jgi:uncharacterized repeat protein (TIGR04138 family)
MQQLDFETAIRKIVATDERYQSEAYVFVQEAIQFTQKSLGRDKQAEKHVGGRELLHGIREYALSMYGPMTTTVLAEWGIRCCEDFGEIVFNMIRHHQATQSPTDSREDFKDGYDFDEAFRQPFLPRGRSLGEVKSASAKSHRHDRF